MRTHLMRSTLILGLLITACLLPATGFSAWQPSRPVQYIIPWAAGGGSDIIARQVVAIIESEKLSPVPFVVENKVGGNAMVALNYLMGKKGDPHTLMFATWTNLAVPLLEKIPYSLKDTTPIARYLLDEQMMWVPWNSPYKSLKEHGRRIQEDPEFDQDRRGVDRERRPLCQCAVPVRRRDQAELHRVSGRCGCRPGPPRRPCGWGLAEPLRSDRPLHRQEDPPPRCGQRGPPGGHEGGAHVQGRGLRRDLRQPLPRRDRSSGHTRRKFRPITWIS